jgi:NAD(P)H-dependent flavin oxidoreductase YrpB (nitropropane dioxygenase family)
MAGGMTTPNLVSAVCNSQALGFLASGYTKSTMLEDNI